MPQVVVASCGGRLFGGACGFTPKNRGHLVATNRRPGSDTLARSL